MIQGRSPPSFMTHDEYLCRRSFGSTVVGARDAGLQDGDLLPQPSILDRNARSVCGERIDRGEETDEEIHGPEDWEIGH